MNEDSSLSEKKLHLIQAVLDTDFEWVLAARVFFDPEFFPEEYAEAPESEQRLALIAEITACQDEDLLFSLLGPLRPEEYREALAKLQAEIGDEEALDEVRQALADTDDEEEQALLQTILNGEEDIAEGRYLTKDEFFEWLDQKDEEYEN